MSKKTILAMSLIVAVASIAAVNFTASAATTIDLVITPSSPIFDTNNVTGVPGDDAPGYPTGSFASDGTGKTDMYFTPEMLFERDVELGEIVSMSYWTKKGTTHVVDPADWFINIYTKPYTGDVSTAAWYGDRIGTEPYFSESINETAGDWNQWMTAAGDNQLRFFESTAGAPGATFGAYTDPHWDDFVGGNALSGDPYSGHEVLFFSVQTGSAWADGFTGQVDGLSIELNDGSVATVNFETDDSDNDGVEGDADLCPGTESDEVEGWDMGFGTNRWQLNDDLNWEQNQKKGGPVGDGRDVTTTYGCNGHQILNLVSELTEEDMSGHYKFGLSSSVLEEFIEDGMDGVIDGYNMESPSDSLVVDSANIAGTNSNIVLENGTDYKVMSSGEWTNRPGETVDTSYVTMDNWVFHTDAPDGGYPADLLELQINADPLFHDWGAYSGAHEYMLMWTGNGAVANFRVFDGDVATNTPNPGWYGDNVGSLNVDIFEFLY